ncbi:LysR substrate-binding domain-containing protein [Colwelliaceae bacterium 6471]
MILPNLRHLHYLVALHKHQHFQRAAQACYVSQSTLSSAILKLEEQLNCQLIERDHKSFIFTSHGEQIVIMAQQLLCSATEMVDFAVQQGGSCAGSLRIGCIPTIAPFLLTDLVKLCQQQLPELVLYFREDTTENLLHLLANGEIDSAILALPVPAHQFQQKVLGKDRFYIAGDPDLVKKFKTVNNYQILPDQSVFLLSKEHCLTEHALSACKLVDLSKVNSFSASSVATLVQMTAFHHGFTFLPEMAVNKGIGKMEGLTIEKLDTNVYREIGMLWRKTSMRQQTFNQLGSVISAIFTP